MGVEITSGDPHTKAGCSKLGPEEMATVVPYCQGSLGSLSATVGGVSAVWHWG